MIGTRMSKQSTSNMLMGKSQVHIHQYYCETMNLPLLPHTRKIMNVLVKEAISANNVSGASLMFWYGSQLNVCSKQHICFHSVITQRHFHNTLHTDKNSNLSSASQKIILDSIRNERNGSSDFRNKVYSKRHEN